MEEARSLLDEKKVVVDAPSSNERALVRGDHRAKPWSETQG